MFGGGSFLLATWLDAPDVAMTPAEAQAIAKPAARILARSVWFTEMYLWLMKTAGKDKDMIALLLAIGAYTWRVAPLVGDKLNEKGGLNGILSGQIAGLRERQAQANEQKAARLNQRNARRRVSLFQRREREQAQPAEQPTHRPADGADTADGGAVHWPTVLGGYGALATESLEVGVVRPDSGGIRPLAR